MWRSSRSFCECLGLAIARKARAPLTSDRFGTFVSQRTSARFATSRFKKAVSVRWGLRTPRIVWRLPPPRSASTTTQRRPRCASAIARFAAITDLPTPPLPPPRAHTQGPPGSSLASGVLGAGVIRAVSGEAFPRSESATETCAPLRAGRRPRRGVGAAPDEEGDSGFRTKSEWLAPGSRGAKSGRATLRLGDLEGRRDRFGQVLPDHQVRLLEVRDGRLRERRDTGQDRLRAPA